MSSETVDPWAPTKKAVGKIGWVLVLGIVIFIVWAAFAKSPVPRPLWGQQFVNEPVTKKTTAYSPARVLLTTRVEFQKNTMTVTRGGAEAGGARITGATKLKAAQVKRDNPLAEYVLAQKSRRVVVTKQTHKGQHVVLTLEDGRKLTLDPTQHQFTVGGIVYKR